MSTISSLAAVGSSKKNNLQCLDTTLYLQGSIRQFFLGVSTSEVAIDHVANKS